MTYQEAVTKLEALGLKVPIRNLDFVKRVAEIIQSLEEKTKTDSEVYTDGRLEGRSDVAARLRTVLDPEDKEHLNLDGLIERVVKVRDDLYGTSSLNPGAAGYAAMWEDKAKELERALDEQPLVAELRFSADDLKDGDVLVINDPDENVTSDDVALFKGAIEKKTGKKLAVLVLSGQTRLDVLTPLEDGSVVRITDADDCMSADAVARLRAYIDKKYEGTGKQIVYLVVSGGSDVQVLPPTAGVMIRGVWPDGRTGTEVVETVNAAIANGFKVTGVRTVPCGA